MPFSSDLISQAVDRYRRERDRYVKLADRVSDICSNDICEQNAIRAHVTFRVKSLKSFEGKLRRFVERLDKNYESVDDIFADISDLSGVRIAAYRHEDCEKIVDHLAQEFRGPIDKVIVDRKDRNREDRSNFYRAIHVQVCLPEDELIGTYDNVDDISCEVQVCTMIAHVWNEIEHDIGYKPESGAPSDDEKKLIEMLGHTVRQGDQQISMLLDANARRISGNCGFVGVEYRDSNFRDVHDFVSKMQDFGDHCMKNFSNYSGQLFDLIEELGINNPLSLRKDLENFNINKLRKEAKEFSSYLTEKEIYDLSIDSDSSDIILMELFKVHLDDILELYRGRVGRGRGRPTRLHRLARKYKEWRSNV